jgi:hypothetical protein
VRFAVTNMVILKRFVVWLLERFIEALLIGLACGYIVGVKFSNTFWTGGFVVAVMLFISGYYVTTAVFGVVWRSQKAWLYPAIAAALFVIHASLFWTGINPSFTPEARAHELLLAVVGACIVFACSFAGGLVLKAWLSADSTPSPYLSATGITLLVFALVNTAHWIRCCSSDGFRPLGLPFIFYREGGYAGTTWVWQSGRFIWLGVIADAALIAATILLLGKAWQRFSAVRAR